MTSVFFTRFKLRGGPSAEWASKNPTLADREPGLETDTASWKFGDGVTPWNSLPYANLRHGEIITTIDEATTAKLEPVIARVEFLERNGGGGGGEGGVTWHGYLNGLGEDDHKIYALADGSRGAFAPVVHTHGWADVTGKPLAFPPTVHTHTWADITDKPLDYAPAPHSHPAADVDGLGDALDGKAPASHTHPWTEVTGKPTEFAPTTHGHTWAQISGAPSTFPPSAHTHTWAEVTGKPTEFAPSAHTHTWADVTAKPTTFPPNPHTHATGDVTGLDTALSGKASTTQAVPPGGITGQVLAKASNTDNDVQWAAPAVAGGDGVTDHGQLTGLTDDDHTLYALADGSRGAFAPTTHSHPISGVTGLDTALSGKSDTGHSHTWAEVTGKPTTYPASAHTHTWIDVTAKPTTFPPDAHAHPLTDVTGLGDALDGKSDDGHTHGWTEVTGKPATYPASAHTHTWADVTDKPTEFAPSAHDHVWADLTDKPATFQPSAHTHAWTAITAKPTEFTPSAHTHGIVDVDGLTAALEGKADDAQVLPAGGGTGQILSKVTAADYNVTWVDPPVGGGGDSGITDHGQLTGLSDDDHPLYALADGTRGAFAPTTHSHTWASVTGKPTEFTPAAHDHIIGDVTGLSDALDSKAGTDHSHSWAQITAKPTTFPAEEHTHSYSSLTDVPATFAPAAHSHAQADVTGLTTALAGKSNTGHAHAWADITSGVPVSFPPSAHTHLWADLTDKPTTFAPSAHSHAIADVTGLGTALSGKAATSHTHLWADITDAPATYAPSAHTHLWAHITDKPSTFTPAAHTHLWADITDKPSTFAPAAHVHSGADITTGTVSGARLGLATSSAQGAITAALFNRLNNAASAATVSTVVLRDAAGRAQFVDPSALQDAATKNYVDTGLGTKAATSHTHAQTDITGLATALSGKSDTSHSHSYAAITDKPSSFTPSAHTHAQSDVTGLGDALAGKASTAQAVPAGGTTGQVLAKTSNADLAVSWQNLAAGGVTDHGALTGLSDDDHPQYALADGTRGSFAPTTHTHTANQVTGLTDVLWTEQKLGPLYAGYARRSTGPVSVIFAGSSTVGGAGLTTAERFVNRLTAHMQKNYPSPAGWETTVVTTANAARTGGGIHGLIKGTGGATSATYLTDADVADFARHNPVMVLHVIGSNDMSTGRSPAVYKATMNDWLNKLDAAMTAPYVNVLVHSFRRGDVTNPAYPWEEYGRALREIGDERSNCLFINAQPTFDALGVPNPDVFSILLDDRIHLDAFGHDVLARLLGEQLAAPANSASFAATSHTHAYTSLTGIPTTFAPSAHTHLWAEISDPPATYTPSAHTHDYTSLTNIPATFAPAAHNHAATDVTSGTFAAARLPAASGTAAGAMSTTHFTRVNNAASAATVSTLVLRDAAGRAQFVDPSALQDAATKNYVDTGLSGKAATSHTHTTAQVTGLDTALAGKLENLTASATTIPSGDPAAITVTGTGTTRDLAFAIPAGPVGQPGRGFTPRGSWAPGTTYQVDDIVTSNGSTFRVTANHTSVTDGSAGTVLRGINIAGAEFGHTDAPGVYGTNFHYDSQESFNYIASRGHKVVRLPFLWERVQTTRGQALDPTLTQHLVDAVTRIHNAGMTAILDMHNYCRRHENGVELVMGRDFPPSDLVDVWDRLSVVFKDHPGVEGYGLMNEPYGLLPPGTTYNFENGTEGWVGTAPTTVAHTTAGAYTGSGALSATRTNLTNAPDQIIQFNDNGGNTLVRSGGAQLYGRVFLPNGSPGTNWRARLEVRDNAGTWHAGSEYPMSQGGWTGLPFTPSEAVWAEAPNAIGVRVICDNPATATATVYFDTFQQFPDGKASSEAGYWEETTQDILTAIRANGDNTTIFIPGYGWSAAKHFHIHHSDPWITDPANNFIYEAHFYFDQDNSGDYPDTYATENSIAVGRGYVNLADQAVDEMSNFTDWCSRYGVKGYIGELGWPNNGDTAGWNSVGEALYDLMDANDISCTYWAAGEAWGTGYILSAYTGNPQNVAEANASVIEAHLGSGGGGDTTTSPTAQTPGPNLELWAASGAPGSDSGGEGSTAWEDITGKPTTFTPSDHTHAAESITSGTLSAERLPEGLPRTDAIQTWTAAQAFSPGTSVKSFSVYPDTPNTPASMYLDNQSGQRWQVFSGSGGQADFAIYNKSAERQPFTLKYGAPVNALVIGPTDISLGLPLNVGDLGITNLADPTEPQDAATKGYMDTRAVPTGGTTGQVLSKTSATNYATQWIDPPSGGATANTPFTVRYTNGAWEYTTLAAAQAAGLNTAQTVWFIGNPGGAMPAWARTGDIWTQG